MQVNERPDHEGLATLEYYHDPAKPYNCFFIIELENGTKIALSESDLLAALLTTKTQTIQLMKDDKKVITAWDTFTD